MIHTINFSHIMHLGNNSIDIKSEIFLHLFLVRFPVVTPSYDNSLKKNVQISKYHWYYCYIMISVLKLKWAAVACLDLKLIKLDKEQTMGSNQKPPHNTLYSMA
eukprot:TRINITY_DN21512_c0_g1_i1.p1 TRINITY_DN21512_c0_g1~~TRINITY_DN21512_c0_g1_i1.p1  ORF type:complete len:104 (-),score=4.69 TRINITY_DN21512_c0_g1_i1:1167-1478(-)